MRSKSTIFAAMHQIQVCTVCSTNVQERLLRSIVLHGVLILVFSSKDRTETSINAGQSSHFILYANLLATPLYSKKILLRRKRDKLQNDVQRRIERLLVAAQVSDREEESGTTSITVNVIQQTLEHETRRLRGRTIQIKLQNMPVQKTTKPAKTNKAHSHHACARHHAVFLFRAALCLALITLPRLEVSI